MRKKRPGFSLLETLIVVTLMGIVAAVGVVNTRLGATRGQTSGLAEIVAEELRGARYRAISQNTPVAVVFPSAGGTTGHCQGLYVLEGQDKPRVTRSTDFSKEYPDSHIFVGTWSSSSTVSRDDIQSGAQGQQLNVAQWGLPFPTDYAIMFTPAGTVKTNGLPNFSGQYHIVVGAGLTSSGAAQPAGSLATSLSYFQLDSVGQPSTINLGPSGGVTLESGVVEGSSVRQEIQPVAGVPGAALQLPAPGPANRDPVVKAARVEPDSETEFEIQPGSQAAMTVEATDPDGDPLYLRCYAVRNNVPADTGVDLGKFSASSPTRMEWVPATSTEPGFYRGNWVWNPPAGMVDGTQVSLKYEVTDGKSSAIGGLVATGTATSQQTVVSYTNKCLVNGRSEICAIQPGVSPRRWVTPYSDDLVCMDASFSPDSQRLAFRAWPPGNKAATQLYCCNLDGTGLQVVSSHCDDVGPTHTPAWSSSGTKIVVSDFGTSGGIWWVSPYGTSSQQLTTSAIDHSVECSPVNIPATSPPTPGAKERVLFIRDKSVCSVPLDGSTLETIHKTELGDVSEPHWSPDGTKLAYVVTTGGNAELKIFDLASTTEKVVASGATAISSVRFSPDGNYLAFIKNNDQELLAVGIDGTKPGDPATPGPKTLDRNNIGTCNWSPDSKQVVYEQAQPGEPSQPIARSFLGRVDVFGADPPTPKWVKPIKDNHRAFLRPSWGVK